MKEKLELSYKAKFSQEFMKEKLELSYKAKL